MSAGVVQINEGTGKGLSYVSFTDEASNTAYMERVTQAEPVSASYTVSISSGISMATANAHLLQIMAGASKRFAIRRIKLWQVATATAAAIKQIQIVLLTTAGTGGGVITPRALDRADAVFSGSAMTLPTGKGTESDILDEFESASWSAIPTTGILTPLVDEEWDDAHSKSIVIPGGTSNGIAIKLITADGGTPLIRGRVKISEGLVAAVA
jgi:hypothetical protein